MSLRSHIFVLLAIFGESAATGSSSTEEMSIFTYGLAVNGLASENHCILFIGGRPVYVFGTYGNIGYFEGAFKNGSLMATVSFYEVSFYWSHSSDPSVVSNTTTPKSGFASWTYSSNFTELRGSFFGSASSELLGSSGVWSASGGIPRDATPSALRRRCLLAKPDAANYRDLLPPVSPDTPPRSRIPDPAAGAFTGAAGALKLCPDGARGVRGNYSYVYTTDEPARGLLKGAAEAGYLAPGAVAFPSAGVGGYGVAGAWLATAGSRAGRPGTGLHVARPGAGLLGYTCDAGGGGWPSGCRFDWYEQAAAAVCPPPASYPQCQAG
jgi:hypothetical protein